MMAWLDYSVHLTHEWTNPEGEKLMFYTCGKCDLTFQGEPCRSCVGKIKAYLCACGERIPNHFWSHKAEHNLIRKVGKNGELY